MNPSPTPPTTPDDRAGLGSSRAASADTTHEVSPRPRGNETIAVVGMGMAVPGASSPDAFWDLLQDGSPVFKEPEGRLDLTNLWADEPTTPDRTYSRVSGFMADFEPHPRLAEEEASGRFIHKEFNARWLRHSLHQASENIASADRQLLAIGLTPDGSQHLEQSLLIHGLEVARESGISIPDSLLSTHYPFGSGSPAELVPAKIARMAIENLPGAWEVSVVDTACSSSLYGIDIGVRALLNDEADVAYCGGSFALSAQNLVLFSKLGGLSRTGQVNSLRHDADGVLFSDGAALVALKTVEAAAAAGDPILGYIAGFGSSSDGRGKAIYAPNPKGQVRALQRAWESPCLDADGPDWIVAHATGTPAGDKAEMVALTTTVGPDKAITLTSNKSLIGHTGWAAGAISTIHALLALNKKVIPGQRPYARLPGDAPDSITVPEGAQAWPANPHKPRTVGVSAMGFGGTNGHLVIADKPQPLTHATSRSTDPVVVVASSTHFPDEPTPMQLQRWFEGAEPSWPEVFGDDYQRPAPVEARLAPSAIAAMDLTQLLVLNCVEGLRDVWVDDKELRDRAGVLIGYSGPTQSALGCGLRYYLDDVIAKVLKPAGIDPDALTKYVHSIVPPTNEDSYPGLMPNIIAARVMQKFDLHGLNMTLDSGADSSQAALVQAIRYLRDGQLDLAIVAGVNTSTHLPVDKTAEGAVAFAVTTSTIAKTHNLAVLGEIEVAQLNDGEVGSLPEGRDYHGVSGAIDLLRALNQSETTGVPIGSKDPYTPGIVCHPTSSDARTTLGADFERHAVTIQQRPHHFVRRPDVAFPDGCLIIVDTPDVLAAQQLPEQCVIVAPRTSIRFGSNTAHTVDWVDKPDALNQLLKQAGQPISHIVVMVSAHASDETTLLVHDLLFSAVKAQSTDRDVALESVGAILLGSFSDVDKETPPTPKPFVSLFGGMMRCLVRERPDADCQVIATDSSDPIIGVAQYVAETASHRVFPTVYFAKGERYELLLQPTPSDTDNPAEIPQDAVLVATGGARGLTTHLVKMLTRRSKAKRVWLLGSGPEPAKSTEPGEAKPDRVTQIRRILSDHPGENIASATRRYEESLRSDERSETITALESICGIGNVRYLQCDVTNDKAVRASIEKIRAVDGRIDIVVHGAGVIRSSELENKKIEDFQLVRDVKVQGYLNLKRAVEDQAPALWCSVSSVSALLGFSGESDYGAANEFLMLAAHQQRTKGRDEVAFTSGLWLESGFASANTPAGAFVARQAELGRLTDAQGKAFFELEFDGRARPHDVSSASQVATTWLCEADWLTLKRISPEIRDDLTADPTRLDNRTGASDVSHTSTKNPMAFLAGKPTVKDGWSTWRCTIGLDEHPYLNDHLVDERPTLPGTFILELGAEAAAQLLAERPTAILDAEFLNFIRASRQRWPLTVEVRARHIDDVVSVVVVSPATELVGEREHARMKVDFGVRPTPKWPVVLPDGNDALNVYQLANSPVSLSGVFDAFAQPTFTVDGGSAQLRLSLGESREILNRFVLPSVTLDCLLRTSVLDGSDRSQIGVMVPTNISRIDLYCGDNDVEISDTHPSNLLLCHRLGDDKNPNECAVVTEDERVLFVAKGVTGFVKSAYDMTQGRWSDAKPSMVG